MRLLKSLLEHFNSYAYHLGLQIVPNHAAVRFGPTLKRVKAIGLKPAIVFDIGVAYGTPELYHAFPYATYHLIDPLPQSLPYMQRWARKLRASIHSIALGDVDSSICIEVHKDIGGSSLFTEGPSAGTTKISVPIKRFDSVFRADDLSRPCVVKIDVQGAELMALRGMGELLGCLDLLIVETRIINTQIGTPHMLEVLDYLRGRNFASEHHLSNFGDAGHPGVAHQLRVEGQQSLRRLRVAA